MTLEPSDPLGPCGILAPAGAGAMGEVWKAKDTSLDRLVALRVLPPHLAGHPAVPARFERAAKSLAALNHPNTLAIHDSATHQRTRCVVTELLEGEPMRALQPDSRLARFVEAVRRNTASRVPR